MLGDNRNTYQDYCPGGKVASAVEQCPAAKASFDRAMKSFLLKHPENNFCEDNHMFTCVWNFSYYMKALDKVDTISAEFTYGSESDALACSYACEALGRPDTKAEEYCANTNSDLATKIANCPEAKQSLDMTTGAWCQEQQLWESPTKFVRAGGSYRILPLSRKPGNVSLSFLKGLHSEVKVDGALRALDGINQSLATPESLSGGYPGARPGETLQEYAEEEQRVEKICADAFTTDRCWDKGPFKSCCEECEKGEAAAAYACAWAFSVHDNKGNKETIGGTFKSRPGETLREWEACDDACTAFKQTELQQTNEMDFCPHLDPNNPHYGKSCAGTPFYSKIEKCQRAVASLEEWCTGDKSHNGQGPMWCTGTLDGSPALSESIRSPTVLAVTLAALSLVVTAATIVKYRSRSLSSEEGYEPFIG